MNYERLYNNLCTLCIETSIKERISNRKNEKYKKLPKSFSSFRFNGLGVKELHRLAMESTGLKLNAYYNNNPKIKEEIKNKIKNIIC